MPVEIKWHIPDHVLHARYWGDVTTEDIRKQYQDGKEMSESVNTPLVHLIADMEKVTSFPKAISDYKGAFGETARNAGWVIVVGDNKLIRFVSTVVSNLMRLRYTYVNTMDEAMQYLVARDPALEEKNTPSKVQE